MITERDGGHLSEFGRSRRNFLKTSAAALGATGAMAVGIGLINPKREPTSPPTVLQAPSELRGIIPNCHLLPYEEEWLQQRFIGEIQTSGASCTRVFLEDSFEMSLGHYKYQPIDKIIALSRKIPLVVDLFDAFYLLHADYDNPGFPSSRLKSPYLVPKEDRSISEQQMAIFTDPEIRGFFMERIYKATEALRNVSGVKGLCIANELGIHFRNMAFARSLHTSFYREAVDVVQHAGWRGPILIGVDDPNLIDEKEFANTPGPVINTIHTYPWDFNRIRSYKSSERYLPFICQEVGVPNRIPQPNGTVLEIADYDLECARFIEATYGRLSIVDYSRGAEKPLISAIGPWRLSVPGDPHKDNYEIQLLKMPQTSKSMTLVRERLLAA